MDKVIIAVVSMFLCSILNVSGQEKEISFGVKGGANHSTYWDHFEEDGRSGFDYKYKTGFFVGGLANFALSEKSSIQTELLFSRRRVGAEVDNFHLQEVTTTTRYRSTRTESVIDLPILFRYRAFGNFFMEAGPQLGYLIQQKEEITESPFRTGEVDLSKFDKFDAGFAAGIGMHLNSRFAIDLRYFQGLVERYNEVSSSVLNLGLEFSF